MENNYIKIRILTPDELDEVVNAQISYITKKYGDIQYNLGWVQDETSITTKLYINPQRIVCSVMEEDGTINHMDNLK